MNFQQEAVIETVIEEEEVKPKPKHKAKSRAKPKHIKIIKEPVEEPASVSEVPQPIVEEPIVEVVEKPKKVDKLKDC